MKIEIDITLNEANQFEVFTSSNENEICKSGLYLTEDTMKSVMNKLNSYIETRINRTIYFKVNGVDVVSRDDYESLWNPICTKNVSNNVMQEIANEIFYTMKIKFGKNDTIAYFENDDEELSINKWKIMNKYFYDIIESIALNNGLNYYKNKDNDDCNNFYINCLITSLKEHKCFDNNRKNQVKHIIEKLRNKDCFPDNNLFIPNVLYQEVGIDNDNLRVSVVNTYLTLISNKFVEDVVSIIVNNNNKINKEEIDKEEIRLHAMTFNKGVHSLLMHKYGMDYDTLKNNYIVFYP